MRERLVIYLLLLASISLLGVKEFGLKPTGSTGGGGCSCGGGGGGEEEIGGGGIAASQTYALKRAELGTTLNMGHSASTTYNATTTLGYQFSEGITLSDTYRTFHPLSQDVIEMPASLVTELEAITEKSQEEK